MAKRKKAYRVGYKKPPQATRFKPGQSGNPRGRPKGSKNLVSAIQKEMDERISITENGRKKRISKRDAIAKQYVNKSIAGDTKPLPYLLKADTDDRDASEGESTETSSLDSPDRLTIESIIRRIREMDPPAAPPDAAPDVAPPTSQPE